MHKVKQHPNPVTPPQEGQKVLDCFEFKLPPKSEFLSPLRQFMWDLLRQVGFSEQEADMIVLAADEALTNSVRYTQSLDEPLYVQIQITTETFQLIIYDDGQEYFERFLQPVEIENHVREMRANGLGLHIIKSVMDSVEYSRTEDNRNILILVKNLPHR
jgi:serine/threonine-protein kinase RsbW